MDAFLDKAKLTNNLWNEYKKTPEYQSGAIYGISANHHIIVEKEQAGLHQIITRLIKDPLLSNRYKHDLTQRQPADWIKEWKLMHKLLFRYVLKPQYIGVYRTNNVRFGDPGDEEKDGFNIPPKELVPSETEKLASSICNHFLAMENLNFDAKFDVLAQIHYQFIRVHPFHDGNGRIGRIVTDQLALSFGFPPAIEGYPRHDPSKRVIYHNAIKSCMKDPSCKELSNWIRGYIERQIETIA